MALQSGGAGTWKEAALLSLAKLGQPNFFHGDSVLLNLLTTTVDIPGTWEASVNTGC